MVYLLCGYPLSFDILTIEEVLQLFPNRESKACVVLVSVVKSIKGAWEVLVFRL